MPSLKHHLNNNLLANGHVVGRVLDSAVDWSVEQLSRGLWQLNVVTQDTQMLPNLPLLNKKQFSSINTHAYTKQNIQQTLSGFASSSVKNTLRNRVQPRTG